LSDKFSSNANERSRRTTAGINPTIKRQFELEIKALQNALRGEDRLEQLLKAKEKERRRRTTTYPLASQRCYYYYLIDLTLLSIVL
jgi:hypothetical protein